jgi:hypothetical protein
MPSLCSLCSQISFLDLPPFPDWLGGYHVPHSPDSELLPFLPKHIDDDLSRRVVPGSLGLPHHPSLANLQEAAASCDVCKLIEQSVGRVRKILEEVQNDKQYVYYNKSGPPLYEFFMSKRRENEDGLLVWSRAEKNHETYLLGAIGFCVDDGIIVTLDRSQIVANVSKTVRSKLTFVAALSAKTQLHQLPSVVSGTG